MAQLPYQTLTKGQVVHGFKFCIQPGLFFYDWIGLA